MPETMPIPQTEVAAAKSTLPPVFIIADDLTGACDSAAAFLGPARMVRVILSPSGSKTPVNLEPATVLAFSTETRNLRRPQAVTAVQQLIATVTNDRLSIFFKKVDSAG